MSDNISPKECVGNLEGWFRYNQVYRVPVPARNPFTEFPTWHPNEYEGHLEEWMSYHREYRASRVRYHEHVHVPIVGPVTMHMTGSEFENLIAHSGYYRGFARNDAIPNQSVMSITVKNIEQIDHGLSLHVIALNCRAVPVLPDFRFVNIRHFIRICLFYDLHVMLDQMINFTLDTGLHYFPQFFRYLCGILSPQNTLVHCLVTGFLTLWNANQLDYLEYYFPAHSEIGPISPTQWAKI